MKKYISTIFLFLVLIVGLSLLLYPSFSDYWNSLHQSYAIANYDAALENLSEEDYSHLFAQAEDYNERIKQIKYPLMYHDQVEGYYEALDVSGTGIIGYISIPMIGVELPIYHGTSEGVLQVAVGHLEGTTLPIGGIGTHAALSAHRGLPSARLFTDLDKLDVGDIFTVTVLDRLLTYEIDQILIVEPSDVEALYVVDGQDYCTLITCTPYGINSHRMLIRGHRIETAEVKAVRRVTADAVQIEPVIVAPLVAAPMLLVLLIWLLLPKRRRKEK